MNFKDSLQVKNLMARKLETVLFNACAKLDDNINIKGKKFKYEDYLSFVKDRINAYVYEYNVGLVGVLDTQSAIMSVLVGSMSTSEHPEIMDKVRRDVISYLIELGADLDTGIAVVDSVSPVGLAEAAGFDDIVELINQSRNAREESGVEDNVL